MKLRSCILLLSLFANVAVSAQEIKDIEVTVTSALLEDGELPYTSSLTWKDFKGRPDNSCSYIAMTYSGIKLKYDYKTRNGVTSVRVRLTPYMETTKSWYKPEGYNNPTLAHEQKHFDITAIMAARLAKELKEHRFTLPSLSGDISDLHNTYLKKLKKMQEEYDEETDHGVKLDKQAAWDRKIATALKEAQL